LGKKSPRLNKLVVVIDSPPIICSRPSFELNMFTQTPLKEGERNDNKIHKSCSIVNPKNKGKEKANEDSILENYQHDSDFEDNCQKVKNSAGIAARKVSNPKRARLVSKKKEQIHTTFKDKEETTTLVFVYQPQRIR
ncbi:hypothetical protein H5410_061303, partial [Solanum commersonii]